MNHEEPVDIRTAARIILKALNPDIRQVLALSLVVGDIDQDKPVLTIDHSHMLDNKEYAKKRAEAGSDEAYYAAEIEALSRCLINAIPAAINAQREADAMAQAANN